MGTELARKAWLWAGAAVVLSGAPASSVCNVPNVTGADVRGRVYDLGRGNEGPPAGAKVRLLNDSGKVVAEALAGEDGQFAVSAPARGRYRLTVTAEGFFEVSAVVVTKKLGKKAPPLRADLGSDAARPCGGGGITVNTFTGGAVGR